jgi:hypothetical protein
MGDGAAQLIVTMVQKKLNKIWRLEVYDAQKSPEWKALMTFDETDCATYQKLAENLNRINHPVQVRIVPHTD